MFRKIIDYLKQRRLRKEWENWMQWQFQVLSLRILEDDVKRSEKQKKFWRQVRRRKSKDDYVV